MTVRERTYATALGVASGLVAGIGRRRGGLSRAVRDRRAAVDRLVDWAVRGRHRELPLLWLHGASAGELVGVAPIVRRVRSRAEIQLLVTFSSPSGSEAAAALEPDWQGFPPLDAPKPCGRAIRAAAPSALVFAKLDVWPGLSAAAERAGAGLGLVNGTVRSDSSRLRGGARWLLRPAYARLQRVGAVSPADAVRLRALGVRPETLTVMGDAAFDAALERVDRARPAQLEARRRLRRWCDSRADPRWPVLLAGSTWPPDEEMLLAAAAALAERGHGLTLVLVPHEPTRSTLARIKARSRSHLGVEPDVWSELSAAP
ncbi:MAG: 3-deoxy-D-manno-octulosonic acid transferase, partial [Gemmatimonadota bacterium]